MTTEQMEISRLQAELALVTMERDMPRPFLQGPERVWTKIRPS
jgi:hypothetical protein